MNQFYLFQETLKDHPKVVWLDTSIRFAKVSTANFSVIKPQLLQTGGVLLMRRTWHTIYAATHPKLYNFIPGDEIRIRNTGQINVA